MYKTKFCASKCASRWNIHPFDINWISCSSYSERMPRLNYLLKGFQCVQAPNGSSLSTRQLIIKPLFQNTVISTPDIYPNLAVSDCPTRCTLPWTKISHQMDSFNPEIHIRFSGGILAKDLNAASFKLQLIFLWTNTWTKTKKTPHLWKYFCFHWVVPWTSSSSY